MLTNGRYIVNGSCKLNGEVSISGAKNSILPIMCASLLSNETVELSNVPNLNDVNVLKNLLEDIGAKVNYNENRMVIKNLNANLKKNTVDKEYSQKIRYSVLMLGLMLAKEKKVVMYYPGGCNLGKRPIDIHLESLAKLGVKFEQEGDLIIGTTTGLVGATINLRFPTVGGTENIIIASVTAKGTTIINNVAREPEIEDLCNFLNSMGAKISGIGTKSLVIEGVKELRGTSHEIIPDRIETATFMAAAATTGGDILIKNTKVEYLFEIMRAIQEMGATIEVIDNKTIRVLGPEKLEAYNFETTVYPGMPTDVQPILVPGLAIANGYSKVEETIYKERFAVAKELNKMGANIKFDGINSVEILGVKNLEGSIVRGADLRAGAGLVIAGLVANGETIIENSYQVNRGYENFEHKLRQLGADIRYEEK